jgi:hypothetical protein
VVVPRRVATRTLSFMPNDARDDDAEAVFEFPPTRNGMPALKADYAPNLFVRYSAALAFEGAASLSYEEHWLTTNLARLTDKAIREHNGARELLDTFIEASHESRLRANPILAAGLMPIEALAALLASSDRLENCIDALRRVDLFLRTRPFQDVVAATAHSYPPPFLDELHEGVRLIRNRIVHAEEDLEEGKIPPGEPLLAAPGADGVSFSGRSVLYAELGALIVTLWHLANAVIEPTAEDATG